MEIVKTKNGYRKATRLEVFLDRVEKFGFCEAMARFYLAHYIGLWGCGITAIAVFATWFASL